MKTLPKTFVDAVGEACKRADGPDKFEELLSGEQKPKYPIVKGFFANPETRDLWRTRT